MIRDEAAKFREQLIRAGFPELLCPRCVDRLDWEPATGRFRLELTEAVLVDLEGAVVAFAREVSGLLHPERLAELRGVDLVDPRGRRPIRGVRADEKRTSLTFELPDDRVTVPFEVFV
jgi:hypothetical protein